jgi:hypothetical protein
MSQRPSTRAAGWRPRIARTNASATEGIYGLILAMSVIAVSREYGEADAGRVALAVLVTAIVFSLAHVYAALLGSAVSRDKTLTRADVLDALRDHWTLVEVAVPLVGVLGLGAIGVLPDRDALVAATVVALVELAIAGGYAAIRQGAGPPATILSAAFALGLGAALVLLKSLVH